MIGIKYGSGIRHKVSVRSFRTELIGFFCAVALGHITLMDGLAPFGAAFLAAASMADIRPRSVLLGVLIGTCLIVPIHIESISACLLFYAVHFLYRKHASEASRMDSLIILFVVQAVLLPVFFIGDVSNFLHGLVNMCICVFSAFSMQHALCIIQTLPMRHVLSDGEQINISILFGILLLSISNVTYKGISLPVILLLIFSMIAALARGIGGVAVAVAISAVLTVGGEFTLMFVGSLAACTLTGAALRKADAIGVFSGFLVCCLIVGSYVFTASHTINVPNLAIAGVVFLSVPKPYMLAVCGYLDAAKNRERFSRKAMQRLRDRTAAEMENTSMACSRIAEHFASRACMSNEPENAKEQWIVQAAANVCSDCPMQGICWENYMQAAESILEMLYAHERGERIRIRKPFHPSCKHMVKMAAAAWQAQNQYHVQHAMQQQSVQQYAFVYRQLNSICSVIDRLSKQVRGDRWLDESLERRLTNGLDRHGIHVYGVDASFPQGHLLLHVRVTDSYREHPLPVLEAVRKTLHRQVRLLHAEKQGRQCTLVMEEAQLLSVSVGTASAAVSKSGISGDCTGVRSLQHGRALCVLSDGMGAGETARKESEAAVQLLFELYTCGFSREIALESVNRLLLEKGKDTYATLDAVHVDLASGKTEFIKFGAPPTFISRGKKLHTICAEALPAGIVDEASPAIREAKLKKDDTVFLFSDGVLDALGDRTQRVILESMAKAEDSQMLSELLLQTAMAYGQEDDMTVMVIRVA